MNAAEAIDLLRSVDLPLGDFAVFGSGPLLVRGIIEEAHDIDIIARDAAWAQALERGELTHLADEDVSVVLFFGGALSVGTSWAYGEVDIDELIDTADTFEGFPFVRIDHVAAYKRIAGRDKDLDHLAQIEQWRQSRPA